MTINADPQELAKFSELAHRWWDTESEFRPLHQINPLRLDWIDQRARLRHARQAWRLAVLFDDQPQPEGLPDGDRRRRVPAQAVAQGHARICALPAPERTGARVSRRRPGAARVVRPGIQPDHAALLAVRRHQRELHAGVPEAGMSMPTRAVLFDLDGTLIDSAP